MAHVLPFALWAVLSQVAALTAAQRDTLERGGIVTTSRMMPSSPWPAMTVLVLIDASPREAAATFIDYDSHASFVPGVRTSHVSRVVDAVTVDVDYVVAVPIVSDEAYTVRDRLSVPGDGAYRVDWTLVRATSTKATTGHVLFTPYTNASTGRAATLMEYHDFVTPGSRLAGIGVVRKRALREMEESAVAIARHTEAVRRNPAQMRARVTALDRALAGGRESTP